MSTPKNLDLQEWPSEKFGPVDNFSFVFGMAPYDNNLMIGVLCFYVMLPKGGGKPMGSKSMQALKKYQNRARACALIAQLPEDDMDAARAVVREFLIMVEEAGLLRPRQSSLAVLSFDGASGGNSPRRRANATGRPHTDPE